MKSEKNYILKIIIVLFIFSFLPSIQSDIISLNAGSSDEFVLTPDQYVEGFLFCNPITCAEVGYNCGTISDNCGRIIECGTCGSGYTCVAGSCVLSEEPPPGGGGGGGGVITIYNIAIVPTQFNINLKVNTNVKETITVTNLEASPITIGVSQFNLTNMILFENTSLSIPAKQKVEVDVVFVAPEEPGIYTGRIIIGGRTVLVTLNVKTELLLFDSNIVVLNENYEVRQGEQLKTLITLIPMGDPTRLDVTLDFKIKDYTNKIYLTRSETLLVEDRVQLKRNFDTGRLPIGDYVVGLELIYPNGVSPSSAHFVVTEKPVSAVLGKIVLFLIALILLIAIMIIIILIIRKLKEGRGISKPPTQTSS